MQVLPLKDKGDPIKATIPVKTRTARYWLQLPNPTLLLVADPETGVIYWGKPIEQLIPRQDAWRQQDTVTLEVLKNTGFNCFSAMPSALCEYMQRGATHIGIAMRERLYDVKACMLEEQPCGPRPIDVAIASQLMNPCGALQDAFGMSIELSNFQSEIADLIEARTRKYANDLWSLSQKIYGRQLRIAGRAGSGLDDDFGAGVPRELIGRAHATLGALKKPLASQQIMVLLLALDELEKLQRNLFDYEEDEFEREYLRAQWHSLTNGEIE
ncbi:DUF4365 domain-containing protein [Pseudomonas pudica]|uniref:DUF4365 domain-containing protein n=1 Tax=Pseudomonas pudica TaxID=272772 RepID=A0ABS0FUR3_9PSED|nr:DUF4365 domain-containing protein [Pseudomonas pudica]MBF8644042.1 DUF4365 domain-containing protein [Pseudomonas pudica]MBF8758591.1 DUF4365 domain-containing protein [Pseudomonas pudica]